MDGRSRTSTNTQRFLLECLSGVAISGDGVQFPWIVGVWLLHYTYSFLLECLSAVVSSGDGVQFPWIVEGLLHYTCRFLLVWPSGVVSSGDGVQVPWMVGVGSLHILVGFSLCGLLAWYHLEMVCRSHGW